MDSLDDGMDASSTRKSDTMDYSLSATSSSDDDASSDADSFSFDDAEPIRHGSGWTCTLTNIKIIIDVLKDHDVYADGSHHTPCSLLDAHPTLGSPHPELDMPAVQDIYRNMLRTKSCPKAKLPSPHSLYTRWNTLFKKWKETRSLEKLFSGTTGDDVAVMRALFEDMVQREDSYRHASKPAPLGKSKSAAKPAATVASGKHVAMAAIGRRSGAGGALRRHGEKAEVGLALRQVGGDAWSLQAQYGCAPSNPTEFQGLLSTAWAVKEYDSKHPPAPASPTSAAPPPSNSLPLGGEPSSLSSSSSSSSSSLSSSSSSSSSSTSATAVRVSRAEPFSGETSPRFLSDTELYAEKRGARRRQQNATDELVRIATLSMQQRDRELALRERELQLREQQEQRNDLMMNMLIQQHHQLSAFLGNSKGATSGAVMPPMAFPTTESQPGSFVIETTTTVSPSTPVSSPSRRPHLAPSSRTSVSATRTASAAMLPTDDDDEGGDTYNDAATFGSDTAETVDARELSTAAEAPSSSSSASSSSSSSASSFVSFPQPSSPRKRPRQPAHSADSAFQYEMPGCRQ